MVFKIRNTHIIRKMGKNGEVYVPKSVREELNLSEGTEFEIGIIDGNVCLIPCKEN